MFSSKNDWCTSEAICDHQDEPIVCSHLWGEHVAACVSDLIGKQIKYGIGKTQNQSVKIYTSAERLTIPERHTLAMMNRYFAIYRPGMCAKDSEINLPYALHALAAPANYLSEAEAFELAEVIAKTCSCDADVMPTDEGFTVVVHDDVGNFNGWMAERIAAITEVVDFFSVTAKRKPRLVMNDSEVGSDSEWQIQIGERHTQQRRIEDSLSAILSRLDAMEAASKATGPRGRGIEALIPPAGKSASKKSAARRSA